LVRGEIERSLSAVPDCQHDGEERFVTPADLLEFLRINGHNDSSVFMPQAVSKLAVITARKRAAGMALRPADGGNPVLGRSKQRG